MHLPLVFMNRFNKTESAVFLYNCRFSLFLKDPFFQIIYLAAHVDTGIG